MMKYALLWLLVCGSLFPQEPAVEKAWGLVGAGHRDQAMALLSQQIRQTPGDVDARLLFGNLLIEAGQSAAAIEQLSQAALLRPKSRDAANSLGEAYRAAGDGKAAEASFERSLTIDPLFGIAQLNLAQMLLKRHATPAAVQHLERAIQLLDKSDDAADALYLRAKVYAGADDSAHAAALLERAVAIRAAFPQAWSDLGHARQSLGQDDTAVTAYRRAVTEDPKDAIAQYRLGALLLKLDQAYEALAPLRAACTLNPENQSILNALQAALRQNGQTEEAAQVRQRLQALLREKDRQNQSALAAIRANNEGAALEKQGDLAGAVLKYREALDLNPEHNGIRTNYAVALLRTGRWMDGLNALHEAAQREPHNDKLQTALRDALKQAPLNAIPNWGRSP